MPLISRRSRHIAYVAVLFDEHCPSLLLASDSLILILRASDLGNASRNSMAQRKFSKLVGKLWSNKKAGVQKDAMFIKKNRY